METGRVAAGMRKKKYNSKMYNLQKILNKFRNKAGKESVIPFHIKRDRKLAEWLGGNKTRGIMNPAESTFLSMEKLRNDAEKFEETPSSFHQ